MQLSCVQVSFSVIKRSSPPPSFGQARAVSSKAAMLAPTARAIILWTAAGPLLQARAKRRPLVMEAVAEILERLGKIYGSAVIASFMLDCHHTRASR